MKRRHTDGDDEDDDCAARQKAQVEPWTCFQCSAPGSERYATITICAPDEAQERQVCMCLLCKWSAPAVFVRGARPRLDPRYANAMSVVACQLQKQRQQFGVPPDAPVIEAEDEVGDRWTNELMNKWNGNGDYAPREAPLSR